MITFAYNLIQDFREGLRSIRKSKGLALGIVISMALGVGATASIFSIVDSFVFRPLPVPATERVVRITNGTPSSPMANFSYPEYQDYVERAQSFSGISTFQYSTLGLA